MTQYNLLDSASKRHFSAYDGEGLNKILAYLQAHDCSYYEYNDDVCSRVISVIDYFISQEFNQKFVRTLNSIFLHTSIVHTQYLLHKLFYGNKSFYQSYISEVVTSKDQECQAVLEKIKIFEKFQYVSSIQSADNLQLLMHYLTKLQKDKMACDKQ